MRHRGPSGLACGESDDAYTDGCHCAECVEVGTGCFLKYIEAGVDLVGRE